MSTTRYGAGYVHTRKPSNSGWRKGCRCPECCAAHEAWLTAQRESGVQRQQYRHATVPLCPVHDAEVYDRCLCGEDGRSEVLIVWLAAVMLLLCAAAWWAL